MFHFACFLILNIKFKQKIRRPLQLKIGKKKTKKEMKAIKEIPSIKKEIDHEFSISPPLTKSKSLAEQDAKPRVSSG